MIEISSGCVFEVLTQCSFGRRSSHARRGPRPSVGEGRSRPDWSSSPRPGRRREAVGRRAWVAGSGLVRWGSGGVELALAEPQSRRGRPRELALPSRRSSFDGARLGKPPVSGGASPSAAWRALREAPPRAPPPLRPRSAASTAGGPGGQRPVQKGDTAGTGLRPPPRSPPDYRRRSASGTLAFP